MIHFLPIVERELRVASRKAVTFWSRFGAALIAIGIFVFTCLSTAGANTAQGAGSDLFETLRWIAFLYCLSAGPRLTADCISEEKREGTLGLLFLTDLRGYDVLAGKLVSSSLHGVYSLLAMLPVMGIPLLLGGVTVGDFWRSALTLVGALAFSLVSGLFVSVRARSQRGAAAGTSFLILLFTALLPVGAGLLKLMEELRSIPVPEPLYLLFLIPSPGYAHFLASNSGNLKQDPVFWASVGTTWALTIGLFLLSASMLPRCWQDAPVTKSERSWLRRLVLWMNGGTSGLGAFRAKTLETNPVMWLALRHRLRANSISCGIAPFLAAWVWCCWKFRGDRFDDYLWPWSIVIAVSLHLVLKWTAALESSRMLSRDVRSGAFELVLSTPLSVREILNGQLLALKRQFFFPTLMVLIFDLTMFGFYAFRGGEAEFRERLEIAALIFGGMLMLVFDLWTLFWVGMWVAISAARANRVTGDIIGRVLFWPWIALYLTAAIFGGLFQRSLGVLGSLTEWFVYGCVIDFFLYRWASTHLRREFRSRALMRFEPQPAKVWQKAGRWFGELRGRMS